MTPLRQAFHAALVVAGLAVAMPVLAEPATPMGPPTADEAAQVVAAEAAAAPVAVAPAPVATPGKSPSWLAARPTPKPVASGRSAIPSLGRMIGLLLVLGTLGIATLYFKRRGVSPEAKRPPSVKKLSVVSSTRIGPKAHAVVISVAGRQILLGVTDSSVKRLAFIDEIEEEEREQEREPARRVGSSALRGAAIAVRTVTPEPVKPGFSDLLKAAFGKRSVPEASAPATDAASILAAETQDTVGGKPVAATSNVRMLDVEGQAQGLIRRLSGPRS
jgi:flagellar biogenesis protein FliO